jgi:hypothetical protein
MKEARNYLLIAIVFFGFFGYAMIIVLISGGVPLVAFIPISMPLVMGALYLIGAYRAYGHPDRPPFPWVNYRPGGGGILTPKNERIGIEPWCRNCNCAAPLDSEYCPNCGKKIELE